MKASFRGLPFILLALCPLGATERQVGWIRIEGTINPATANYIDRAAAVSEDQGMECLVIQLDTPGGLLDSTQAIVKRFYSTPVPIVVYVAPSGANAGSAGCFITLAGDVAAMAPNTSIGAAHPVMMGGSQEDSESSKTMNQKLENFAASYIEAIADKRKRNAEWAISAVRDSASVTAEAALELNVIDLIAKDSKDLLQQLDGRPLDKLGEAALQTAGAQVEEIGMLLRERIFQMLWRPEVMFILMLIAIYGIIGELNAPGMVLPGVIGLIALILVLYMAAILPVNIAGMALMVLAVALFIAEAFTPTFGLLTTGGIISFFLGALMLFDRGLPEFRLSLGVIIPATLLTAGFFIFVVGAGLRAQRLPIRVGRETLPGMTGIAMDGLGSKPGHVTIEGEDWLAESAVPVNKGETVKIIGRRGLRLIVRPIEKEGK
ncbi:MAG: nodulation protein NfeD [Puniceicoccaceae bacterium]